MRTAALPTDDRQHQSCSIQPTEAARLPCPLQAIQSRDRIQLQYSQSLIEKDQYRKQVRGLEAERDELLTTVTSLEGTKAMLEAQLQRTQGGSCLKVSGARSITFWDWGAVDLENLASWGKNMLA